MQAEMTMILITGWCECEDGWSSLETICLHADTGLPDVSQAKSWHPLCFAFAGVSASPPPRVLFFFYYTFCVKITFLSVMKSLSTLKTGPVSQSEPFIFLVWYFKTNKISWLFFEHFLCFAFIPRVFEIAINKASAHNPINVIYQSKSFFSYLFFSF